MIGILSDAHGNRPAFDLAINVLKRNGAEKFVFLGDAVGYLPTPSVLSSIQNLGETISCIRGNHEDILLTGHFDPAREPLYQHEVTRQQMDEAQLLLIKAWPVQAALEFAAGTVLFLHGSPQDPTYGYVYPDTDLAAFPVKEKFVFMGHTHRPFIRQHGGATFINVGSCGLPRDHGAFGSAVLFDDQTGDIRILRFDIQRETHEALEATGQVHPSVKSIFNRKPQEFEGELVEK